MNKVWMISVKTMRFLLFFKLKGFRQVKKIVVVLAHE